MSVEVYAPSGKGENYPLEAVKVGFVGEHLLETEIIRKVGYGVASTWGLERFGDNGIDNMDVLPMDVRKALLIHGLEGKVFLGAHLEGVGVTFEALNGSRSMVQQLTRCRLAGYGHEGTRDTNLEKFDFIVPETISSNNKLRRMGRDLLNQMRGYIRECNAQGIPQQDSSMFAPLGLCSDVIVHTNLRVLFDSWRIRLTNQTKWEINGVFKALAAAMTEVWPTISLWFVAPCELKGCCVSQGTLFPPCGKMPLREGQSYLSNHFGEGFKYSDKQNPSGKAYLLEAQVAAEKRTKRAKLVAWSTKVLEDFRRGE